MSTDQSGTGIDRVEGELESLVVECLDRYEHDGDAALDALCEREPRFATSLRARFRTLRDAGLLPTSREEVFPERLGDFRLMRRLGSGGMGVVYLAEQTSLGRRVALKLVRPDQLYFAGTRERFRREVEAAAALDHASIVRIHCVGEESGIPFFAMEHVVGATLSEIAARFSGSSATRLSGSDLRAAVVAVAAADPQASGEDVLGLFAGTWTRAALRIGVAIASALEHAHARGVLHRDVKPGNVMITADGRAVLLDFGLAARAGSTKLTRTGSQLGSLAYMAPEQIEGRARDIGPRTDVHGLGVSLYELFALASAYSGGSATDLARRIVAGPQPLLRARDPSLPRDLEVVCAKAMEPEIARRYASATELRVDLENVLAGRPITARPATPLERALRWTRRHPAAASAATLAFVLCVGGPIAFAIQQGRERSRVEEAKRDVDAANTRLGEALQVAREESARAERNFEKALEAVGLLTEVGRDGLSDVPQAEEARRELLERALQFHEDLLAERQGDRRLAFEATRTKVLVGELLGALARWDEADAVLRDALNDLEAAPATVSSNDIAELTARVAKVLGSSLGTRGQPGAAVTVVERGIERLRAEVASERASSDVRAALAASLADLAEYRRRSGDTEGARQAWSDAGELFAGLAELEPEEPRWLAEVGRAYVELAVMLRGFNLPTSAQASPGVLFERAVDVLGESVPALARAVEADPTSVARRVRLANARMHLATALVSIVRYDAALVEARSAAELSRALADEQPRTLEHTSRYVRSLNVLGIALRNANLVGEALANDLELLRVRENEIALHPDRPQLLAGTAIVEQNLGLTYHQLGEHPEAARMFDRAVSRFDEYLRRQPQDKDAHGMRNHACSLVALERGELGELSAAAAAVERMAEPISARHVHFRALALSRMASQGAAAGEDPGRVKAWRERAIDDVELGYHLGSKDGAFVDREELAPLRGDPRFEAAAEDARRRFR